MRSAVETSGIQICVGKHIPLHPMPSGRGTVPDDPSIKQVGIFHFKEEIPVRTEIRAVPGLNRCHTFGWFRTAPGDRLRHRTGRHPVGPACHDRSGAEPARDAEILMEHFERLHAAVRRCHRLGQK